MAVNFTRKPTLWSVKGLNMQSDDLTLGFTGCGCDDELAPAGGPPGAFMRTRSDAFSLHGLLRTIEGDIVPRLVMARATAPEMSTSLRSPTREELDELVRLLLSHDSGVALAYIAELHREGIALEALCLELMAPAARRVGELWEQDRADIMEVTLALSRLHTVLRELSVLRNPDAESRPAQGRVLLAPSPGEQHTFGLMLVAEFLRRSGWEVASEFPASTPELLELVAGERFSVVGLSVACDARLDGLASRIQSIRRASRNRGIGVMVGGRVFVERPELAPAVGADATASDGRVAAAQVRRLCGLLAEAH